MKRNEKIIELNNRKIRLSNTRLSSYAQLIHHDILIDLVYEGNSNFENKEVTIVAGGFLANKVKNIFPSENIEGTEYLITDIDYKRLREETRQFEIESGHYDQQMRDY